MRQDVKLYINDKQIELREPFHIMMNYTAEEVTAPTAVKNNYTKTLIIEGTKKNNQIFANLWDVRRIADGSMYDYDLTRKNEFKIFYNGELAETGYVKLNKIVRKTNVVEYSLTLFGGLGDFFYNLSMDETGKKRKLSDLDFGAGKNEFNFDVSAQNVKYAWDRLSYDYSYNSKVVYDKINFAPCYNGIPNDWDTRKFLCDVNNNPFLVQPQPSGPSAAGGVFLSQVTTDRDYTEWEAGDLRAYKQRPVLRVRALIDAICNPKNNGGYKVTLDPKFFNLDNPYFEKSWITLPLLDETDSTVTDSETKTIETEKGIAPGRVVIPIDIQAVTFAGNKGSIKVPYLLSVHPDQSFSSGIQRIFNSYKEIEIGVGTKYCSSTFIVQLVAKDRNGNVRYGSEVQMISNDWNNFELSDYPYHPALNTTVNKIRGKFEYTKQNKYEFEKRWCWIGIENMQLEQNMTFELQIAKVFGPGSELPLSYNTFYRSKFPYENITDPLRELAISASAKVEVGAGDFEQKTVMKYKFSKDRMLNTNETPLDYLLGYTKQVGLYFIKDPARKEIQIMTRNSYYGSSGIIDLSDKIDVARGMTMTPIPFDKKWYEFKLKNEKSKYAEKYRKTNDTEFGIQRVNTNYEYDKSTKNLLDKNCYKNAVMLREMSNYKCNFRAEYLTTQNPLPPAMIDGMQTYFFSPSREVQEGSSSLKATKISSLPPLYSTQYYDRAPMMCFYDEDRKPIDGSNVLCFFNGMVNAADNNNNETWLRLSDDTEEMNDLNDNKPCWIYSTVKTKKLDKFPLFSRYMTSRGNVQSSWNAGNPVETYTFDYTFTDASSVYSKFWRNFIIDQYDKNTRVLECYVRLTERVTPDFLRNLFYFEGCYWILLSITDYDLCGNGTTKCKFIKVEDVSHYLTGQSL